MFCRIGTVSTDDAVVAGGSVTVSGAAVVSAFGTVVAAAVVCGAAVHADPAQLLFPYPADEVQAGAGVAQHVAALIRLGAIPAILMVAGIDDQDIPQSALSRRFLRQWFLSAVLFLFRPAAPCLPAVQKPVSSL